MPPKPTTQQVIWRINLAEVYWIRLPEHTDVFSQGYVGVTRHTALRRFSGHKSEAVRHVNNSIIGNAIRKYGGELIVETLVICDIEYAIGLEIKLRPEDKIGWNTVMGGGLPPITYGDRMSKEKREAVTSAKRGVPLSEEARQRMRDAWKTREPSKLTREDRQMAIKKSSETKPAWTYAGAFMDIWSDADIYFSEFSKGTKQKACANLFNVKVTRLSAMFKRFRKGWIPEEDALWLNEFRKDKVSAP